MITFVFGKIYWNLSKRSILLFLIGLILAFIFAENNLKDLIVLIVVIIFLYMLSIVQNNLFINKKGLRIYFQQFVKWSDINQIEIKAYKTETLLVIYYRSQKISIGVGSNTFPIFIFKQKKIMPTEIYRKFVKAILKYKAD